MLNKLCNLNALLLALAPVLSVYSLAGLTMSFFVIWVVAGLNILAARRLELSFFLCILVLGFLSFLLNSGQGFYSTELYVNNLFAIVSFFIALVFCTSNVNINLFKKTVCFVGVIAACICIFQRLQFIATGSYLNNFFIAGLEVKRDLDMFSYGRPSAFFTEPAHLAIYLLPVLYLTLVEKKTFVVFCYRYWNFGVWLNHRLFAFVCSFSVQFDSRREKHQEYYLWWYVDNRSLWCSNISITRHSSFKYGEVAVNRV